MGYRYAVVLATQEPGPIGDAWRTWRSTVRLAQPVWRPRADVYESGDAVTVTVDLAGVDADELDVQLFEDALVIGGQRRNPEPATEGVYHAAEIPRGRFKLTLALPAVLDLDRVDARLERGLLELTLPKAGGNGHGR
jgi:HSP20 family protein